MKRDIKGDIFATYRPKGLSCTKFMDVRYTVAPDPPVHRHRVAPAPTNLAQRISLAERIEGKYSVEYATCKKQEVLLLTRNYITALNLQESLQDDMANTFDFLFPLFPKGSRMHESSQLAEIIVFHVLKERNLFLDPFEFQRISPKGDMPMCYRSWLLRYKQFVPSSRKKAAVALPDMFLNLLYNYPKTSDKFRAKCEEIKPIISKLSGNARPMILAGMICYMAFKATPLPDLSITDAMNTMGIKYLGTIINAIRRVKTRWKSVWALFFKEETRPCRER